MIDAQLFVDTRLKPSLKFYEFCKSKFPTIEIEVKDDLIKTSKRRTSKIIRYRLRKNTNFNRFNMYDYFELVLTSTKRIEVQTYFVTRSILDEYPYTEEFNFYLHNLCIMMDDEVIKIKRTAWDEYEFGTNPMSSMGWYHNLTYYPQNYTDLYRHSPIKYAGYNTYIDKDLLMVVYKYRNLLENLSNIKAYNLYSDVVNSRADMRTLTRNFISKNKFYLKKYDYSFSQIIDLRQLQGKVKFNPTNLQAIKELALSWPVFQNTQEICNQHKLSFEKTLNYIVKNKGVFITYRDYLNMVTELGIKLTGKVVYPSNLKKEHDELIELINMKRREKFIAGFAETSSIYKNLSFSNEKLIISVPDTPEQLYDEGKALKHCVASTAYFEKYSKQKTTLLFIRDVKEPNRSLYTLEMKNMKIIQCRGLQNKSAPKEVFDFIEEWKKHLKINGIENRNIN